MKLHELTIDPPAQKEGAMSHLSQGGTVTFMENGVRKVLSMDEYFKSKGIHSVTRRETRVDDHLGAVGE